MSEQIKSMIRHIVTSLGAVAAVFGISELAGVINLIAENIDTLFGIISSIGGVIAIMKGFFHNKERFTDRS